MESTVVSFLGFLAFVIVALVVILLIASEKIAWLEYKAGGFRIRTRPRK